MHLRVEDCVIDTDTRQVLRGNREVPLSPKAFQLLSLLAARRPKALSKDDLHRALWPDTFVVEANLSNLIGEIRAALGDSARQPRIVRTVHGYGYAFCAETAPEGPQAPAITFCLEFGGERFQLRAGVNVVGRSPDADVGLNVSGVSRLHARLVIANDEAFVEDAGSKNGTYVQGELLRSRRRLGANDEIAFGSARVRFRIIEPIGVTETI